MAVRPAGRPGTDRLPAVQPSHQQRAGFTSQGSGLLLGVNIGGLGTLVASLASLISFRLYAKTPEAKAGRYLGVFTLVNGGLLLLLLPFGLLLA